MISPTRSMLTWLAAAALLAASPAPAAAQDDAGTSAPAATEYSSPAEAAKAFAEAFKAKDREKILKVFGPDAADLLDSGDEVDDANRLEAFSKVVGQLVAVDKSITDTATILVGAERWPFPIPLVKDGDKWYFDTEAGADEILNRRIGQNELSAIKVCRAIVAAQKEFFEMDPDGDGVKEYALKIRSDEGKKNGLYWPATEGEPESPMGPEVAEAQAEGYGDENAKPDPNVRPVYHGYHYKGLAKQGAKAPGGAMSFVTNGKALAGWALVAWPAEYADSGVMSFIVSQDGVVYEKDLGDDTEKIAESMTEYNPDSTWTEAK